jgi:hypothetical protein
LRIFDRIASGEDIYTQGPPPGPLDSTGQASWRKLCNTSVRIIADEAAQFESQSYAAREIDGGDYGLMRPPFTSMWIEWITPSAVFSEGRWTRRRRASVATVVQHQSANVLSFATLMTFPDAHITIYPVHVEIANFDDLGSICATGQITHLADEAIAEFGSREEALGALYREIDPAFLTLGWLNCRNVTTEDVRPNARIAAKRERRGQPRGLDYKRIVLDESTRRALTVNRDAEKHGKRLHIVRGHIKHFTPERPLFGKYTGNYWWHQQMRGNADLGRINHEYHVASRGPR